MPINTFETYICYFLKNSQIPLPENSIDSKTYNDFKNKVFEAVESQSFSSKFKGMDITYFELITVVKPMMVMIEKELSENSGNLSFFERYFSGVKSFLIKIIESGLIDDYDELNDEAIELYKLLDSTFQKDD